MTAAPAVSPPVPAPEEAPGYPLNVTLTNTVSLNTGDAAILLGIVRILESAFGERLALTIRDRQPEVAARLYPELSFQGWPHRRVARRPLGIVNRARYGAGVATLRSGRHGLARRLLNDAELADAVHYASADLVVSTGGTYLVENYNLEPPLLDHRLTRLTRRPHILFTQSLGPFTRRRHIAAIRRTVDEAQLVLLRDERSRSHLEALGVRGHNLRVSADSAFALTDESAVARARYAPIAADRPLKVAISVRDWAKFRAVDSAVGMDRFRRSVASLTAHLIERHGAEVSFVSTCQGVPEYWTDDSAVAAQIADSLPKRVRERVRVDRDFHRPETLMGILGAHDLVIGTRMHMGILALAAGVPVLPIAYEFKTEELFGRLGVGDWVQDIETVTPDSLSAAADGFLEALPALRAQLFDSVLVERKTAFDSGLVARRALHGQYV